MPGQDDHDLERRLREEPVEADEERVEADEERVEADEEMTLAEARWLLRVTVALVLVAGAVAFSGVSTVPHALPGGVLAVLEQARDSSTAALRSAVGESVSGLGGVASKVGGVASEVGAVASKVAAVPNALGGDVVGALQQARDSSTAALRSAVGGEPASSKRFQTGSPEPFHKQYHTKVFICMPNALVYVTRSVSARSVPSLVSKGAIYPVPAGGC